MIGIIVYVVDYIGLRFCFKGIMNVFDRDLKSDFVVVLVAELLSNFSQNWPDNVKA